MANNERREDKGVANKDMLSQSSYSQITKQWKINSGLLKKKKEERGGEREREGGREEAGGKEEESGDTGNQSCLTEFKLNVSEHGP